MAFDAFESTTADEQDILRIHVDEFLLRMLAPSLGRHVYDAAFQKFEHGLLHTFAGYVAGDGGIVGLSGDLVNLVDEDDAPLGFLKVEIGLLQQAGEDAFHVFAHIAGLGEDRSVHNGEGHIQHLGDGAGQKCLAGSGGTHQQDVALLQFHAVIGLLDQVVVHPLIMVVNGDGQHFLGAVLPDHILIQVVFDLLGLGSLSQFGGRCRLLSLLPLQFIDVLGGQFGAIRTDIAVHSLQQERDFGICAAAEHAMTAMSAVTNGLLCHQRFLLRRISSTMP